MADERIWLVDEVGDLELTDLTSYVVERGRQGLYMPPVAMVEEVVPLQPGSRLRNARADVRVVDLPLLLEGSSESAYLTLRRALARRLSPLRDVRLRVRAVDASERELYCRYAGGLDQVQLTATSLRCVLTFRAHDPYWYGRNALVTTYVTGTPATFFPFFPLRLSSSTIFADTTIDNAGDVEAWPQWLITGPGSALVLRNLTTGKLLSLGTVIAAGETVSIDTRPGYKSVELNDGTNLFGDLSATSALWALEAGSNSIRIELSSATAASAVRLTYYQRTWGA